MGVLFSDNTLLLLKNINTYYADPKNMHNSYSIGYCIPDIGGEMQAEGRYNPAKLGNTNGGYKHRYFISALFDALYSNGTNANTYTWRTGWKAATANNSKYIAGNCCLMFGIIPIAWSAGDNVEGQPAERYSVSGNIAQSRLGWRTGDQTDDFYRNALALHAYQDFLIGLEPTPNKCGFIPDYKTMQEFNSLTDQDDPSSVWSSTLLEKRYCYAIARWSSSTVFGLGINPNIPGNNYKQLSFDRPNTIFENFQDSFTLEKYERTSSLKNTISPKAGTRIREGIVIAKNNSANPPVLDWTPCWGYYKQNYSTTYGTTDDDEVIMSNRSGKILAQTSRTWDSIHNDTVGNYPGYSAEPFFGSVNVQYTAGRLLEYSLDNILSQLNSNTMYSVSYNHYHSQDPVFPIIIKNGTLSEFSLHNMFSCSTIRLLTQKTYMGDGHGAYGNRFLDVIPVFATSLQAVSQSGTTYHGACCIIHLFQSLIYNVHYNDPITNGSGGYAYEYELEDDEIPMNTSTYVDTTFANSPQTLNTHAGYQGFTMKSMDGNKIYISYALTVNGTGKNVTGITAGPAVAGATDWIAWINGNIYVIPDSVFRTYVFYTQNDYTLLDTAGVLMGYNTRQRH